MPADSTRAAAPTATTFGKTKEGVDAQLFTLTNAHGLKATITNFGGTLTSLLVPDKEGKMGDVVLGFDNLADYTSDDISEGETLTSGLLIGRYGNRIAKGKFSLDGKQYQLPINNAPNSLHGGTTGFNRRLWTATPGTSADGPDPDAQVLE
ncbi:MAG: hypothetical protein WKG07_38020 [Hymenobacter sp.]